MNEFTMISKPVHDCDQQASPQVPFRVIHVIPQLGGGGTERVVWSLLPKLDPQVCRPSLCVLGSQNAFPQRTAAISVDGFLGYSGSLRDPIGMWRCVRRLRKIIRTEKADIVHSHLWPAARLTAMAVRGLPCRHVVHVHDTRPWLEGTARRDRFQRWWTKATVLRSQASYIAVSQAVKDYTCGHLGVDPKNVHVIHNGVDLDRFRVRPRTKGTSNRRMVFGTVARFDPEKGHDYLVEAARKIAKTGVDFEIRLAGDGSLRPKIEAQVTALGLTDRVHFSGLIEDVDSFLQEIDVFVLPSVFGEGLPMTILEAMACRLPVVATDVGGTGEVIQNEKTGMLVAPKNSTRLADSMLRLAGDQQFREAIADQGYDLVRNHFSFEKVAREVESLYQNIATQPNARL